jgi:hypothetical protein
MEVHVLDNYYLAITLLITIGYQLFFFAIAFSLKFDKLTGTSPLENVDARIYANSLQTSLEEPTSLS